jgi:hypothetical protein
MAEENDNYLDAIEDNDIVEIVDALGDQLYVLLGTIFISRDTIHYRRCLTEIPALICLS